MRIQEQGMNFTVCLSNSLPGYLWYKKKKFKIDIFSWDHTSPFLLVECFEKSLLLLLHTLAQSAGAVEYTDCTSAEV